MSSPKDPYSRLQYRRFVAWPKRIEREWPLLEEVLGSGGGNRVLDLGCGTGEHSRFLAAKGFEVLGIDRSESMLEAANEDELPPGLRFVRADLENLEQLADVALGGDFGGAICLGNTLPHLSERTQLEGMVRGLRKALRKGAAVLVQLLNYERIFARGERHLPLNFRGEDPESEQAGELVFLRLMDLHDDGRVTFCPTTLRLRAAAETPVELVASRRVELRGWRRGELEEIFDAAGFGERTYYGGYGREPYEPEGSRDLLLIAR